MQQRGPFGLPSQKEGSIGSEAHRQSRKELLKPRPLPRGLGKGTAGRLSLGKLTPIEPSFCGFQWKSASDSHSATPDTGTREITNLDTKTEK